MNEEIATVSGFTWRKRPLSGEEVSGRPGSRYEEVWDLVWPLNTAWCLKDYGNFGSIESFSGIRLVSGGPFTEAGKWSDFATAMREVAPFVRQIAKRHRYEAENTLNAINEFIATLPKE